MSKPKVCETKFGRLVIREDVDGCLMYSVYYGERSSELAARDAAVAIDSGYKVLLVPNVPVTVNID